MKLMKLCSCGKPVPYAAREQCWECLPRYKHREFPHIPKQIKNPNRWPRKKVLEFTQQHPDWKRTDIALKTGYSLSGVCRLTSAVRQPKKTTHSCVQCGKPVPHGRRNNKFAAYMHCFDCWGKGQRDKGGMSYVDVICPVCNKTFRVRRGEWQRRVRQKARIAKKNAKPDDGKITCSRSCGSQIAIEHYGKPFKNAISKRFKRQPGWSDEQWEWEKKLQESGLGMLRGYNPRVLSGDGALNFADQFANGIRPRNWNEAGVGSD
jgi:hypothetical protein